QRALLSGSAPRTRSGPLRREAALLEDREGGIFLDRQGARRPLRGGRHYAAGRCAGCEGRRGLQRSQDGGSFDARSEAVRRPPAQRPKGSRVIVVAGERWLWRTSRSGTV